MTPDRRQRVAAWWWLGIAVVVGNAFYDILMAKAAKEYLLRQAMAEAGLGPRVSVQDIMDAALYSAVWQSTLAAGLILLAAMLTIRSLTGR